MGSVSAIVLAAGLSRRMGAQNKLLLRYSGKPLVRYVVEAVAGSKAGEVVVVVGFEQERIREALEGLDVSFVANERYEEGMGTSIRAGVKAATDEATGYMVCLSDLPLIESEEYDRIIDAFLANHERDPQAIVIPSFEGQRGNPVVLSSFYREAMLAQQGVVGCRGIVKQHPRHITIVEMDTDHVVRDVDTIEAFEALAKVWKRF